MKLESTGFSKLEIINLNLLGDERGYFTRFFCEETFSKLGLPNHFPQINYSFSKKRGTIRGMHYQVNGFEECKVISCVSGAIFDVVIDLRPSSETFMKYYSVILEENDGKKFVIPEGFAHGFQTLKNNTSVIYQVTKEYSQGNERGIRYNDKTFSINWPLKVSSISKKDLEHLDFKL